MNRHPRCPSRQPGFTLLELVLVVLIISIMGLIAIDRLFEYRIDAERAMIQTVTGNIRSGLGMAIAERVARDRIDTVNDLEHTNPVEFLSQPPNNYLGEIDNESQVNEEGVWYFDTSESALVYRVRFGDYFNTPLSGAPRVRYRIQLVYNDNNRNNRLDPGTDDVTGLDLVTLEDYEWEFPNE
ncbi:prepilin-type N-terminal cleavage/methylation domain-containing protein [Thiohalophilus thiocyanatoxydans]|uniref:Prepilin-type N-terminal cleavage/methylation domain-containing protein n=1 Tax=Thiohalophilus thiocyanatoxydans TaxID=381308 RepID=A0A4V3H4N4_9GAMM|nr:prepilin-type N-terminal cleavage/methylation domain-containing protein [Thiohalophilus thiocyanatoxydans]TDY03835.1 prepilin-type N-terminal cleavage/methylation domain-containing protein [Thiohalophilus thiocyanatoxydans]